MSVSSPKVLVVEDSPAFAKLLLAWLNELAFESKHYGSAEDALEALATDGHYDVILLDLTLPGMNGHAMLRHLQRAKNSTPVVMMSGDGQVDDVVRVLRADVVDYLAKPFRLKDLEDALERALAKKKVPEAATTPEPRRKIRRAPAEKPVEPKKPSVRSAVAALKDALERGVLELPVASPRASELQQFLSRDDYGVDEVAEVIGRDSGIAGIIMKAANSAFYSRGRSIKSIRDACIWIGPSLVVGMALEVAMRNQNKTEHEPFNSIIRKMTDNAFAAARIAVGIARHLKRKDDAEIFVLALLHNLGEPLCVQLFAELHATGEAEFSVADLDEEVGRVHEPFGMALVGSWKLPSVFGRFAGDHHQKPKSEPHEEETRQVLLASWALAIEVGNDYFPSHQEVSAKPHLAALGIDSALADELIDKTLGGGSD